MTSVAIGGEEWYVRSNMDILPSSQSSNGLLLFALNLLNFKDVSNTCVLTILNCCHMKAISVYRRWGNFVMI